MNRIKHYLIFGILIIIVFTLAYRTVEAFPRYVKWRQIRTDHFVIVFAEQHQHVAQYVASMAESAHRDIAGFLNYTDDSETYIVITDETDTFPLLNALGADFVLISLGQPQAELLGFSSQTQGRLFRQFVSQYSSVIRHNMDGTLRSIFSVPFPDAGLSGWMDGGMAVFMEAFLHGENRSPFVDMFMRAEILENRLTSLAQRAAFGLRKWPEDLGMFVYGYSFMHYLAETYGATQLAQLNRTQATTIPWPFFGSDAFKQVYGKEFTSLHQEWQEAVRQMYQAQLQELQSQPVTNTQPLSASGYWTHSPIFSPDGNFVYYIEDSPHDDPALMQFQLSDMSSTQLAEGNFSGSFSLSNDGQRLFFSKTQIFKTFYDVSDVYMLDLSDRKITRLTKGERAFDPAISPDAKTLVYTTVDTGSMNLMKMDLASGQKTILMKTSDYSQIRYPVFSSDSTKLVFQMMTLGGSQDIYLINSDGTNLISLTSDSFYDTSPTWGLNDELIFFSSDRNGVPNIFAYSLREHALHQVTNVLTGAFDPGAAPNGNQLAVTLYSADGMDIHLLDLSQKTWQKVALEEQHRPPATAQVSEISHSPLEGDQEDVTPDSRYNPLPHLFPGPFPIYGGDEDGLQLGLGLSAEDILEQHRYTIGILYGLESGRIAFGAEYVNSQFFPSLHLFGYDYAQVYSNLFFNNYGGDEDYWERRRGGGIDLMIPLFRSRRSDLYLTTGYEYTKLDNLTNLDELITPLPDEGTLASVAGGIMIKSFDEYRYSISPESGVFALLEYERNDEIFGSDFNIDKLVGEINVYLNSFFRRHVIALKAAGGLSDGDTLTQGVFQLGGYYFNRQTDLWYEPQFFLRGYEENSFAGDRIATGTLEYRFPIWFPQHTLWDGRILWDSISGTAFFESGDAWDSDDDPELKHSAGAQLNMRVGLRHGRLPLTLGVGFAHGFDKDKGESQVYFQLTVDN